MAKMSTVCYLEKDGRYLMLHRTKKENDENRDKWLGVGGKFEAGESPEDCMKREVWEETGLTPTAWEYRGIITFVSDVITTEYMHLFRVTDWTGEQIECDEGDLDWIAREKLLSLPMWEGDRIFLDLIGTPHPFFSLKLTYEGEHLTGAVLDGNPLST